MYKIQNLAKLDKDNETISMPMSPAISCKHIHKIIKGTFKGLARLHLPEPYYNELEGRGTKKYFTGYDHLIIKSSFTNGNVYMFFVDTGTGIKAIAEYRDIKNISPALSINPKANDFEKVLSRKELETIFNEVKDKIKILTPFPDPPDPFEGVTAPIIYNKDNLININVSYNREHGITEADIAKVNGLIFLIEKRLIKNPIPKAGDIVECSTLLKEKQKMYQGRIERVDNNEVSICTQPYTPFTWNIDINIRCDMSGGYWLSPKKELLKYVKTNQALFKVWGSCGMQPNGAVNFYANVNVWKYSGQEVY